MYTVTCGLEKNALEDVIEASLALHAQGLASAAEKNTEEYLSLSIDSVGHCIRYANIKVSLSQIFLYMDRIQGHIWENTYQRKLVS